MDPASLDSDYWCHLKEDGACPMPVTPEIDISFMWPEKPEKAYVAPEPSDETFNVLHVSDFHIETQYKIGSEANCSTYMCCTSHSSNELPLPEGQSPISGLNDQEIAGMNLFNSTWDDAYKKGDYVGYNESVWEPAYSFGQYKCDSPELLINSSLDSVAQFQKEKNLTFDFAIFTGDLVDHDESKFIGIEKALLSEEIIFRDFKNRLSDIPLYPVLGNHDTFPYAQLAQRNSGFENFFEYNAELMAEMWEDYEWIDFDTAQYAKQHYTGFSVKTKRGLKIIALNSNAWYSANFYNYWNTTNPDSYGQFQFLVDELTEAEANDERVWIIWHIPLLNPDAMPIAGQVWKQIIERFSPYTIAGMFNGHTHRDEFNVVYDATGSDSSAKTEDKVLNNVWISQAVTPIIENNPGWKYYEVDTKTFSIMNSFNYYTKLNETFYNNGEATPVWEFEYSARDAYGIDWPKSSPLNGTYWHRVSESIKNSRATLQTYEGYAKRLSPFVPDCLSTDDCQLDWCYVTSFTADQLVNCMAAENVTGSDYA
ncbi:unnamed protein product [Ambrosiozyma monospora]|uniref:Unnamed protein product n=1 Tax=Ambrosiozyma monospora TaxID=43982 RepID=A0ACB5T896_AMBMO|nr:unnamed protein product [Ambrosiozyma monospora]